MLENGLLMETRPQSDLPDVSLRNVPHSLWGFQREATTRLVEQLRSAQQALQTERVELRARIGRLEEACLHSGDSERRLTAELEEMRSERDRLRTREQVLEVELHATKRELGRLDSREALLGQMFDTARRMSYEMRAEARLDAEKTLKKAREREAATRRQAERELKNISAERERLRSVIGELRGRLSIAFEQLDGGAQPGSDGSVSPQGLPAESRSRADERGLRERAAARRLAEVLERHDEQARQVSARVRTTAADRRRVGGERNDGIRSRDQSFLRRGSGGGRCGCPSSRVRPGEFEESAATTVDASAATTVHTDPPADADRSDSHAANQSHLVRSILVHTAHRIAVVVLQGILLLAVIAGILAITKVVHF